MSKIKRSPKQWESLRKKERMFREKKVLNDRLKSLKHQLDNIGNNELPSEVKSIQLELEKHDTSQMMYHLTRPNIWKKIQKEGLKGGSDQTKHGKDKGWLYMVDTDDKDIWNGISSFSIMRKSQTTPPSWYNKFGNPIHRVYRHNHPYIVIGVPKVYFEINGFDFVGDSSEDLTNWKGNHKSVHLKDHIIHPVFLTEVYRGITDQWKYEVEDRWLWGHKMKEKELGETIPIEKMRMFDGLFGYIDYSERKKLNTISYYHKPPSKIVDIVTKTNEVVKKENLYKNLNSQSHSNSSESGWSVGDFQKSSSNNENFEKVVDKSDESSFTLNVNQHSKKKEENLVFGKTG